LTKVWGNPEREAPTGRCKSDYESENDGGERCAASELLKNRKIQACEDCRGVFVGKRGFVGEGYFTPSNGRGNNGGKLRERA